MTRENLKKNGTLLGETDIYRSGIYKYTKETYYYNNRIYISEIHPNINEYTGTSATYLVSDNVANDFNIFCEDHLKRWYSLDDDELKNLKYNILMGQL